MRRREFITFLSSVSVVALEWPLAVRAQQTRLPIIGFLGANATAWSPWTTAFVQRLHELGWIEGRTVTIEYRWNEGQPERITAIAAEFIRLKVDVIVTNAIAAPTLKQGTTVIPIVFAIAPDPVADIMECPLMTHLCHFALKFAVMHNTVLSRWYDRV